MLRNLMLVANASSAVVGFAVLGLAAALHVGERPEAHVAAGGRALTLTLNLTLTLTLTLTLILILTLALALALACGEAGRGREDQSGDGGHRHRRRGLGGLVQLGRYRGDIWDAGACPAG